MEMLQNENTTKPANQTDKILSFTCIFNFTKKEDFFFITSLIRSNTIQLAILKLLNIKPLLRRQPEWELHKTLQQLQWTQWR